MTPRHVDQALRLDGDIEVNMSALAFIDAFILVAWKTCAAVTSARISRSRCTSHSTWFYS
jgi:hypothetical protein